MNPDEHNEVNQTSGPIGTDDQLSINLKTGHHGITEVYSAQS
jgi:hypothetical protein